MQKEHKKGYILHANWISERDSLVQTLRQQVVGWDLDIFSAVDGRNYENRPDLAKLHPRTRQPVTPGTIGCTLSHVKILQGLISTSSRPDTPSQMLILEDDCIFVLPYLQWQLYILTADACTQGEWDILLLGATEYVESAIASFCMRRVWRFWGTHAVIVKPHAAEAILKTFMDTQREGYCMPADWLYNEAIRRHGLVCYGPLDPHCLCRQAPGLASSNEGEVRR
jgi:GR25 family glycosyltransferase involved in LPS biosynthesis